MKTKTILKTLAVALLMPAMLLTTACSSNDNIIDSEKSANTKGYALPVTVNVTRQGDEPATRATYTDTGNGTGSLAFSTGDKLFVQADNSPAGKFAGLLDYDSEKGKFSGTIMTQNAYSGTADALLAATSSPFAALVPAGYGNYNFFTIYGEGTYNASLVQDYSKAFALTKKEAVEQFSYEAAYSYSSGFTLEPNNAIINFTISGLAANTAVAVSFHDIYDNTSSSVTTDALGVATFVVGMPGYSYLEYYSLTVDGNNIAMPTKTVEASHIYNISRSVAPATQLNSSITTWTTGSYAVPSGGLTYSNAVTVNGNVTLTLTDGETLTLNKGISLASGATLTIQGNGTMNVNGTDGNTSSTAGGNHGTLVLTSGTLYARGGNGGSVGNYCDDSHGGNGGDAISGTLTIKGGSTSVNDGSNGSIGSNCDNCTAGTGGKGHN